MLRRPRTITSNTKTPKTIKPQQARQLIRRYHVLQKNRKCIEQLLVQRDPTFDLDLFLLSPDSIYIQELNTYKYSSNAEMCHIHNQLLQDDLVRLLARVDAEINQRGGLHVYQMASTVGQANERGGDSLKWLVSVYRKLQRRSKRVLEIGSLSPTNGVLTSGLFGEVTRIDLNSQHPQILQQNFMERPLPQSSCDKFDLISCSLVLNFVPTAKDRGEMLKRTTLFLEPPSTESRSSLFLVLPLPCVSNSRYFNRKVLSEIMTGLGFEQVQYYEAKKVAYWLFDWKKPMNNLGVRAKTEVNPGKKRNNFYIDMNK